VLTRAPLFSRALSPPSPPKHYKQQANNGNPDVARVVDDMARAALANPENEPAAMLHAATLVPAPLLVEELLLRNTHLPRSLHHTASTEIKWNALLRMAKNRVSAYAARERNHGYRAAIERNMLRMSELLAQLRAARAGGDAALEAELDAEMDELSAASRTLVEAGPHRFTVAPGEGAASTEEGGRGVGFQGGRSRRLEG
jgi:hypothetical protein